MHCPFCQNPDTRVTDTRVSADGKSIKRRRECPECFKRFTTFETIEELPLVVVKKDKRREPFNNKKILNGLMKAFEKRPVSMDEILALVNSIEQEIRRKYEREVESTTIGDIVMHTLMRVDQVAYVRFASVYRQFADINTFMDEIQKLSSKVLLHNLDTKQNKGDTK